MRLFNSLRFKNRGGFTFIELVMVITIFTILSGVALFNFGDYSDSIALQNLANQISLEIVSAQRDAISGRNPDAFISPNRPSYGVYFNSGSISNKEFVYFPDYFNDKEYDSLDFDSSETIQITRGNIISNLEVSDNGIWSSRSDLAITFTRPYPDASIRNSGLSYSGARIVVESPRGNQRTIEVSSLGQVSVK